VQLHLLAAFFLFIGNIVPFMTLYKQVNVWFIMLLLMLFSSILAFVFSMLGLRNEKFMELIPLHKLIHIVFMVS